MFVCLGVVSILFINVRYVMGLIPFPDPAAPPKKPPRPGAPGHLSSLASLGSPGDNYNEGVKVSARACAQPRTPQSLSLWALTLRCAVGSGLGGIGRAPWSAPDSSESGQTLLENSLFCFSLM